MPDGSISHSSTEAALVPAGAPAAAESAANPPIAATEEPGTGSILRHPALAIAQNGLFVLALGYTLYFARPFILPIVTAVLLHFLLSPAIRGLKRFGLSEPLGAAVILVLLLTTLGIGLYQLAGPANDWIASAPQTLNRVEPRLRALAGPLLRVKKTADEAERATTLPDASKTPEVVVREPGLSSQVFGTTRSLVSGAIEIVLLLYFLLASGDLFLQKIVGFLPQFGDKKKAVALVREAERLIAAYLGTVTLINIGVGLAVALAMYLIDMPNPVLWGALATTLEFIPYLGAFVMVCVLTITALASFDTTAHALLAPALYFAINFVQGNFFTPMLLGRRLTLNPVAIVVGLMLWWWLWGLPGVFLAVPLLATIKIFCDHIEALNPVGELLGK